MARITLMFFPSLSVSTTCDMIYALHWLVMPRKICLALQTELLCCNDGQWSFWLYKRMMQIVIVCIALIVVLRCFFFRSQQFTLGPHSGICNCVVYPDNSCACWIHILSQEKTMAKSWFKVLTYFIFEFMPV